MTKMQLGNFADIPKEAQVERWEHAIDVLKKMTPHERRKHWDMGVWAIKSACGTVGCAASRCALDPWFKRRGFRLFYRKTGRTFPVFNEMYTHSAVEKFFGYNGSNLIFFNTNSRPVRKVISEINAYIKELKAA